LKVSETPEGTPNGTEIPYFRKFLANLEKLSSYSEIPENADPFATGNFRNLNQNSPLNGNFPLGLMSGKQEIYSVPFSQLSLNSKLYISLVF